MGFTICTVNNILRPLTGVRTNLPVLWVQEVQCLQGTVSAPLRSQIKALTTPSVMSGNCIFTSSVGSVPHLCHFRLSHLHLGRLCSPRLAALLVELSVSSPMISTTNLQDRLLEVWLSCSLCPLITTYTPTCTQWESLMRAKRVIRIFITSCTTPKTTC